MRSTLRFLIIAALLPWLGLVIALTFYVAPSLFANESGRVPDSSAAADILAPLFSKMYATGWIAIGFALALHAVYLRVTASPARRLIFVSGGLLLAALAGEFTAGLAVNPRVHEVRAELGREFGGYHLAPAADFRRAEFGRLHGWAMTLAILDLALGLGAVYCLARSDGPAFRRAQASVERAPSPAE